MAKLPGNEFFINPETRGRAVRTMVATKNATNNGFGGMSPRFKMWFRDTPNAAIIQKKKMGSGVKGDTPNPGRYCCVKLAAVIEKVRIPAKIPAARKKE